jgi:hypothetical protein
MIALSTNAAYLAGYNLERCGAAIFRALGAHVEHDVSLAGSQIDLLVREQSASGTSGTSLIAP